MEPQKPNNSPGPGPEVIKRQKVAKERVVQRVRSWTVQNKMRDVLCWMTGVTREHKFLSGYREDTCVEGFRCYGRPPIREKSRYEKLQKTGVVHPAWPTQEPSRFLGEMSVRGPIVS